MNSALFRLRQVSLWGDYGDVLISGYAARDTKSGKLLLHRSGPFVPPIFLPSLSSGGASVVVTQAFREQLDRSGLTGLLYRPVTKNRIIDLRWETWDRNADNPATFPDSGEPEDYIWEEEHSELAASQMEDLWELVPPIISCDVELEFSDTLGVPNRYYFTPTGAEYRGLFRDREDYCEYLIDLPAKEWLTSHASDWVDFDTLFSK